MSIRISTFIVAFSVLCPSGGLTLPLPFLILSSFGSGICQLRNEEEVGGQGLVSCPLGRWRKDRPLFSHPLFPACEDLKTRRTEGKENFASMSCPLDILVVRCHQEVWGVLASVQLRGFLWIFEKLKKSHLQGLDEKKHGDWFIMASHRFRICGGEKNTTMTFPFKMAVIVHGVRRADGDVEIWREFVLPGRSSEFHVYPLGI